MKPVRCLVAIALLMSCTESPAGVDPVVTVVVNPPSADVVVGHAAQFAASPENASGKPLAGRPIRWSTSNTTLADVDNAGLVTAKAVGGPVTITATSEGKSGTAAVRVLAIPVASVTVAPATADVILGQTQQLTATPKAANGDSLSGRTITWTTDNAAIADVNANGLVSAKAVGGPVTITATSEGKSGTAAITVVPAPVASVTVTPPSASIMIGTTAQLAATPKDANGTPLAGRAVTWASDNTAIAAVDSTGLVSAKMVGGPITITATSEGHSGTAAITVTSFPATGPLRVSTVNPRYFADPSGRIVYLTGSHTWLNSQDGGPTDPPAAFSWTAYLDALQAHHHNLIKLWRWEAARWSAETTIDFYYDPMPYMRPGPDLALDGKPKFDLDQFNPAYFARMRQHIIEAGQRGIYVSVMLFNAWSTEDKRMGNNNPWHGHPFNKNNNINGVDGDPAGFDGAPAPDDQGIETELMYPELYPRQEAYVRQVIDAVNDLDNVLYEISNEETGVGGAVEWQYHMIQYIRQYEATKPKQHPIGMTVFSPGGTNDVLFASSADWIAPNAGGGDGIGNPAASDGSKVIIDDTDHLCGVCGEISWPWMSLLRGRNPILMDPWDGANPVTSAPYDASDPKWEEIRVQLGYARTFAERVNLGTMTPHGELISTGFCLANIGVEYLGYLPFGGTATLDLSAVTGTLTVEWFDPSNGQTIPGGTTTGGGVVSFTTPTSGHAILYLHR